MEQAIRTSLLQETMKHAREYASEILKTYMLPDGRSFKQYIEDVLTKTNTKNPGYMDRSRLKQAVEGRLYEECTRLFNEIARPELDALKVQIKSRISEMIIA